MRTSALLLLSILLSACASEQPQVEASQSVETDTVANTPQVLTLPGHLSEAQLIQKFEEIQASGIDTSQSYKWEFRFTSNIMSSLEDFAQTAHILNFWPVALESDPTGSKYWLYIQKTHQYTQSEFVEEVTTLFKMAEYRKLDSFDGFSIDRPDTI